MHHAMRDAKRKMETAQDELLKAARQQVAADMQDLARDARMAFDAMQNWDAKDEWDDPEAEKAWRLLRDVMREAFEAGARYQEAKGATRYLTADPKLTAALREAEAAWREGCADTETGEDHETA